MLSSHLAWEKIENLLIRVAPIEAFDKKKWDEVLQESFTKFPKKKIFSILNEFLPNKFLENFINEFCSDFAHKMVGEISKKHREYLAKMLGEGIVLTLLERRPGDEFVTAGGVETSEVDAKTLESKISKNLYFVGEVLNVDGYTGGFSLQICWSTGFVAGKSIAQKLNEK